MLNLSFFFFIFFFLLLSYFFKDNFANLSSYIPHLLGIVIFFMGLTIELKELLHTLRKFKWIIITISNGIWMISKSSLNPCHWPSTVDGGPAQAIQCTCPAAVGYAQYHPVSYKLDHFAVSAVEDDVRTSNNVVSDRTAW